MAVIRPERWGRRRTPAAGAVTLVPPPVLSDPPDSSIVAALTRQSTLVMQLRHAGLDVLECRDVDQLASMSRVVAMAVVDLTNGEGRRGLIARIGTTVDERVPLVLVSADQVDLAILRGSRTVHVVVPPVRAEDVVAAVERVLLDLASARVEIVTGPPAAEVAGPITEPIVIPVVSEGRPPAAEAPAPLPLPPPAAVVAGRAPDAPGRKSSPRVRRRAVPTPPPADGTALPWPALARQLLDQVASLPSLAQLAQRLAAEVAAESGLDVAVLVQDPQDGCWDVVGGAGLRTLEWGQRIDEAHWLVVTGQDRGPGLHVPDTDRVRSDLVGAPLASRAQLVRVQARSRQFIICAGWSSGDAVGATVMLRLSAAVNRYEQAFTDVLLLRGVAAELGSVVDGDTSASG
jgi:hypothetical protein